MMTARDKMLKGRHDGLIQNECRLAEAIMAEFPTMTRSKALREAARILEKSEYP